MRLLTQIFCVLLTLFAYDLAPAPFNYLAMGLVASITFTLGGWCGRPRKEKVEYEPYPYL